MSSSGTSINFGLPNMHIPCCNLDQKTGSLWQGVCHINGLQQVINQCSCLGVYRLIPKMKTKGRCPMMCALSGSCVLWSNWLGWHVIIIRLWLPLVQYSETDNFSSFSLLCQTWTVDLASAVSFLQSYYRYIQISKLVDKFSSIGHFSMFSIYHFYPVRKYFYCIGNYYF